MFPLLSKRMTASFGETRESLFPSFVSFLPTRRFSLPSDLPFPLPSASLLPSSAASHLDPESHRQIHAGLDAYHALLVSWKSNPSAYSPKDLRANMDSWREVLFRHLDEEVADLGKENMLKFWTLEEVKRLPI